MLDDVVKINSDGTASLSVIIKANAKKNEIVGVVNEEKRIKISVIAPATDGLANAMLIKFLSKQLKTSPSKIIILKGVNNSRKLLEIPGDSIVILNKSI
jgi:uncharacterized protein (TIGR00251 family)